MERRKIVLDDPIKTLGDFQVTLRLHKDVSMEIAVHVVKEEE
ncbi:MAG TPA: 50S ribosomal L9 C-terminal domain-containing protein [Bryobacteraceae bacterium]|nr:50S ribosomal L9 C-terminal domain-containing protein [Bryobacteraceae bacterium]